MAKEKAKKDAKPRKKGGVGVVFMMVLVGCVVPFGLPTLLISIGLFPTLIALITDTDEDHATSVTIGFLNFAGVLPFYLDLWSNGQTMAVALRILRDPMSWVVMFGAAAMGQLLLYAIPPGIAAVTLSQQESRLKKLREGIEELKNVWGPDVTNTSPLEAVRQRNGAPPALALHK